MEISQGGTAMRNERDIFVRLFRQTEEAATQVASSRWRLRL